MLSAALDAVGLNRAVVGLGDADLYRQLLTELGVDGRAARARSSTGSRRTTSSASRRRSTEVEGLRGRAAARRCCACPGCAAAPRSSTRRASWAAARSSAPTQRLQATYEALAERGVADRVQLDLSLLRDLGYYTGAILEVYDPALGHILGGGGRYDDLLGQFGRADAGGRLQPLPRARAPRSDGGGAHRQGGEELMTPDRRGADPHPRAAGR